MNKLVESSFHATAAALVFASALAVRAQPAPDAIDPAQIGRELNAAGAPVAAANGLPAFAGLELPEPGWDATKNRAKSWKHRDEKPTLTITGQNVAQHAKKLTPGQRVLFEQNPAYQMQVYPTHRSCAVPQFVTDNTRKGFGQAKVDSAGKAVAGGIYPSYPFPGTKSGVEAIWNATLRYSGVGNISPIVSTAISPRPGTNDWIVTKSQVIGYTPLSAKGELKMSDVDSVVSTAFIKYLEPVALAGQALVTKTKMGETAETYYYFPGQRRVRRMPSYAYDAPIMGMDNQMIVDQSYGFIGLPDRFDWKLVEEKNIYIPYNDFAFADPEAKFEDVVSDKAPNAQARRYEEHRVYVLEATVKSGMRHTTPKRYMYLDVDTYQVVVAEDYDTQGKLWKVREVFMAPTWELGGVCMPFAYWQYDTASQRYIMDNILAGNGPAARPQFFIESKDSKFNMNFYTQDNLKAMSER